jgi:hypothetical protein
MRSVCLIITHSRSLVAESLVLVLNDDVTRMPNAIVKNPMEAIHSGTTQNSMPTDDPNDGMWTPEEPESEILAESVM